MKSDVKKKTKSMIKKMLTSVVKITAPTPVAMLFISQYVCASQDAIMAPINSLKALVIGIIGAIGVIVLGFGILEFGSAVQAQDPSQQTAGIKKIVGGILMASVSLIMGFLGFS